MSSLMQREMSYALTYKDVVDILRLVRESAHCQSFELQLGDLKLSITYRCASDAANEAPHAGLIAPPAVAEKPERAPEPKIGLDVVAVRAPMLGTFYRAPAPGEPPYVEVGDIVEEGDTVGLIDVMKLFTQITAPVSGRVVEIPAENGALVEYGQPLVLIEPL